MTESCLEKMVGLEENAKCFVLESMKLVLENMKRLKEETATKERLQQLESERSKAEKSEADKRERKKLRNFVCKQKTKAKRAARIAEARNV